MIPLQVFSSEEKIEGQASAQDSLNVSPALNADPMSSGYLLQLIMGLFVVLLCIVVLAWAAKKINRFRFIADDSLKIIGGLSMGSRERVVLLQVGENQLLIGVAPGRINTLHVLETPIETTDSRSDESLGRSFSESLGFSNKLKNMMADANKDQLHKNQFNKKQDEQ